MTIFSKSVVASSDDAIQNASTNNVLLTAKIEISSTYNPAGVRFTNVTIPKGATIDSATLTVVVDNNTADIPKLRIHCEAADNAGTFVATANNISSRTLTTNYAYWNIPSPGTGSGSKTSPDFKDAVQEIVNRAGWSSGNALATILVDDGGNFRFHSYDTGTPAQLTVTYTVSGGGDDPPPDPVPDSGDYSGGVMITGDGDLSGGGPYIDVFTVERVDDANGWDAPPTVTPRVRLGRLDGVLGGARGEWGIAGGVDLNNADSTTAQYFVASDTGLWLQNLSLRMFKDAKQTINISPDGTVGFGKDVTTNLGTGFRYTPDNGNVIMGAYSPGKVHAAWRGLEEKFGIWRNISSGVDDPIFVFDKDGNNTIGGWLNIGTSGGIYQGTGTPDSPTKGLKIYNSGGQGRISFFDGNETMRLSADDGLSFMAINGSNIKTSLTFVGRGYDTTLRPYGGLSSYTNYNYTYYDHEDKIYLWMGSGHVYGEAGARVYLTRAYNAGPPPPWGYNNLDIKVGLEAGDAKFELSPTYGTYAKLIAASLFIPDGGVAAGYSNIPNMGKGVYASDLRNGSNPAFVWQDTSNIGHGMTSIADTRTYANLRKHDNTNGGIKLSGFTKTKTAISLEPYVTTVDGVYSGNPMTTGKHGALRISAHKKSGTSAGAFADGDLLFTVEDDGASRFGVTRQGNFYYAGGGTAFDAEDDMGLISAIAHTWEGTVTQEWERFIGDNKTRLQEIGVLSGDFINGPALNRLIVGAMRQMMTRINQLEEKLA